MYQEKRVNLNEEEYVFNIVHVIFHRQDIGLKVRGIMMKFIRFL